MRRADPPASPCDGWDELPRPLVAKPRRPKNLLPARHWRSHLVSMIGTVSLDRLAARRNWGMGV